MSPFPRCAAFVLITVMFIFLQERMRAVLSIASKLYCLLSCFLKFTQTCREILTIFFIKIQKSLSRSTCWCNRLLLFLLSGTSKYMHYSELFFVSVQMDISCVLAASLISLPMLEFGMKQPLAPTVVWKYRVLSPPGIWVRGYSWVTLRTPEVK